MAEQWKQIDGFPNHLVSSEGRIWSKNGQGGISQKALGKLYNTSQAQIYYIVNRITWKNIEEAQDDKLHRAF